MGFFHVTHCPLLGCTAAPSLSAYTPARSQAPSVRGAQQRSAFVSEAEGTAAKGTLQDQGSDVLLFLEL